MHTVRKACHAYKCVPTLGIPEGHVQNWKPHTGTGGNRKSSIPCGNFIASCIQVANNAACRSRVESPVFMQLQRRFLAALQPCGPGTIACEENGIQTEETIFDGKIQELLLVKPENKPERIFRLEVPAFQKEKQFDTMLEESQGVFSLFFYRLEISSF